MARNDPFPSQWDTIQRDVLENKNFLRHATSHEELKDFAARHGIDTGLKFGAFKTILRTIGVDYDALRAQTLAARDEEYRAALDALTGAAPTVWLWAGGNINQAGEGSFAIVDEYEEALWFGKLFDTDRTFRHGDLLSAEQSAAEKALFIARKCFDAAGVTAGVAVVNSTCPDLDGDSLHHDAKHYGLRLVLEITDDDRAIAMAEVNGFRRWQDSDLAGVVKNCGH